MTLNKLIALGAFFTAAVVVIIGCLYFVVFGTIGALLIAAGTLPFCIVCLALSVYFGLRAPTYDIFAPLNFFALSWLFGITLQTMLIVCVRGWTTDTFLMLGRPPESLLMGLVYSNVSAIALSCGFLMPVHGIDVSRFAVIRKDNWNKPRLIFVCLVMASIAAISTMLYLHRMGISLSSLVQKLSAKRRLVVEGAEYQYAALGYLLLGTSLFDNIFRALFALFASSRKGLLSPLGALCVAAGLCACIMPVITSSRTSIMLLIVSSVITWHYLRRPLSAVKLGGAVLVCALLLAVLGILRAGKGNVSALSESHGDIVEEITKTLIGRRHFHAISVTTNVINAVPDPLNYQFGRTYLLWMLAPIPRELWKEKPVIRVGQVVGMAAFDRTRDVTGVPPGIIGELYWNFGFLGPAFGMFGLGVFLNILYKSFVPLVRTNKNAMLIYFPIMFGSCFGGDFTGIVLGIASATVINIIILKFIGMSNVRRNVQSPAASVIRSY